MVCGFNNIKVVRGFGIFGVGTYWMILLLLYYVILLIHIIIIENGSKFV
jgi:flagellar biosynthesis component FlhA